jgi:hypothetical protein
MPFGSLRRVCAALVIALAAPACGASPAAPPQTGPVRLTAHVNRIQVTPGATAVATFRLENVTANTVTLNFGSSCQILPFIVKPPANQVVYPAGGGWACAQVLTSITLPPHGVTVREITVTSGVQAFDLVALPPGDYAFYAKVESVEYTLESERVALQVL